MFFRGEELYGAPYTPTRCTVACQSGGAGASHRSGGLCFGRLRRPRFRCCGELTCICGRMVMTGKKKERWLERKQARILGQHQYLGLPKESRPCHCAYVLHGLLYMYSMPYLRVPRANSANRSANVLAIYCCADMRYGAGLCQSHSRLPC